MNKNELDGRGRDLGELSAAELLDRFHGAVISAPDNDPDTIQSDTIEWVVIGAEKDPQTSEMRILLTEHTEDSGINKKHKTINLREFLSWQNPA